MTTKRTGYPVMDEILDSIAPVTTKAATINLDNRGQPFAGVATIRAAIFDVLDAPFGTRLMYEGTQVRCANGITETVSEETATAERSDFVNAVIARIAELQNPPHDGIKIENLCDKHKRLVLPRPSVNVCVACTAEREVSHG